MPKVQEKSRLTFIKRVNGGKHPRALYRCVCGVEKEIIEHSVRQNIIISCGCYHKEVSTKHGLYKHPLYAAWANMKDRCYNQNAENYSDYGGRGVIMFDGWIDDFKAFYDWCMKNGWKKGLQVDKDIKGDNLIYSPETCVIATSKANNNAKRNNRFVEFNGVVKTITAWSEEYGVTVYTLRRRLGKGNVITTIDMLRPARPKRPNHYFLMI